MDYRNYQETTFRKIFFLKVHQFYKTLKDIFNLRLCLFNVRDDSELKLFIKCKDDFEFKFFLNKWSFLEEQKLQNTVRKKYL